MNIRHIPVHFFLISILICILMARKVAIVGGGFGGLSVGSKLAKQVELLHIYDPLTIGDASASSIAGGLMHPLAPRGNIVWKGLEGFSSTETALKGLQAMGYKDLIRPSTRLVRPVYKEEDYETWTKAATDTPHLVKLASHASLSSEITNSNKALAYFEITKALVFSPVNYLQSLWYYIAKECKKSAWIGQVVEDVRDLISSYDIVIIAGGHGSPALYKQLLVYNNPLKVQYVRGRIYQCNNDIAGKESLQVAMLSGEYLVPGQDSGTNRYVLSCGATYDHLKETDAAGCFNDFIYRNKALNHDQTGSVDIKLRKKMETIYPSFTKEEHFLLSESSAIRLVTERSNLGRLPIVGRHPDHDTVYLLTGLGSRGLVYHSLMATYLTDAILHNRLDCIPDCLHPKAHSSRK